MMKGPGDDLTPTFIIEPKISGPGSFSPGAADKFSEIANKSLLLGEGAQWAHWGG